MSVYKVVGLKRWAGTMEGKEIDSAKIYVEVKLDDTRNGKDGKTDQFAKGIAVEELRLPNGRHLASIEGYDLPFYVDVSTERVSNGKQSREVVTGVRYHADKDGVQPSAAVASVPRKAA